MTEIIAPLRIAENEEDAFAPRLNEISNKFIADCIIEKQRLGEDFPLAAMLIDEAIDTVLTTGRIPGREMYADVLKQKPMKISQKVFLATKQFPKFNFIGKILGPKGNSLRRLQEETMCKIKIKGRHSMRNPVKEEELRSSGDPRLAHLNKDLYVEISAVALPAEAYARVAYALAEIRKYLVPDKNDEVSRSQIKESMADPDPEAAKKAAVYVEKIASKSSYKGYVDKNSTISILQKLTGKAVENGKTANFERDYEDREEEYLRQTAQLKRLPPSQESYEHQTTQKRSREDSYGDQTKYSHSFSNQKYQ